MTSYIQSVKEHCIKHNVPIMSDNTVTFLQSLLAGRTIRHYAEIGTAQGYSTLVIAEMLKEQRPHIYTWEISYPQYKQALTHFSGYQEARIRSYYADATTCDRGKYMYHKLDAVFVDAQKSSYQKIVESIRAHICHDGILIIDDVIKFKYKMQSLYHRLDQNGIQHTVHKLDDDDGVLVIEKRHNQHLARE